MKRAIPGIPNYEMAKPFFERMFESFTLLHQEHSEEHQFFIVETEFCRIESQWTLERGQHVFWGPKEECFRGRLRTIREMEQALGESVYGLKQAAQLAWLDRHGLLLRAWSQESRFIELETIFHKISEQLAELGFHNDNPIPDLRLPNTDRQPTLTNPDFHLEGPAKTLVMRARPYLRLIFGDSATQISESVKDGVLHLIFWNKDLALRIKSANNSETISFAPSSILETDQWFTIPRIMKTSLHLIQEKSMECQLYLWVTHLGYFEKLSDLQTFETTMGYFANLDTLWHQLRDLATQAI